MSAIIGILTHSMSAIFGILTHYYAILKSKMVYIYIYTSESKCPKIALNEYFWTEWKIAY